MVYSLPKGYLISTDNGDDEYFYLTDPAGDVIDQGWDEGDLIALAWKLYREKK